MKEESEQLWIYIKKYLIILAMGIPEQLHSIQCIPGCRLCCPSHCRHLMDDGTCDVHPLRLGISEIEAERLGRGMGCHSTPWQLFINAVACPPVIETLHNIYDIEVSWHIGDFGVGVIDNFVEIKEQLLYLRNNS